MDKLLTIVIPTYNMQDYLRKCLDSLIVDESKMSLLEVLIINDGSKDRSSEIAHEYESKFPKTFRVIDKENGNYGSCVNRGLKEATGKYIKILDADDYFCTDAFCQLVQRMEDVDVDMVFSDFHKVDPQDNIIEKCQISAPSGIFNFRDYDNISPIRMHSIAYRTSLLRQMGYHQTEGISYTDVEWSILPTSEVKTAVYYPLDIYSYLLGREGQTMDPNIVSKTAYMHIIIAKRVLNMYGSLQENHDSELIRRRVYGVIEEITRIIYKSSLLEMPPSLFDKRSLKDYDNILLSRCQDVYFSLEQSMIPNGIPFHYVKFWHKTGMRFPLAFARVFIRKIRYGIK